MMYDLHAALVPLQGGVGDRMAEASKQLPSAGLVAFNGVPFVGDPLTYFRREITIELLREQVQLALGFGGVLTYMNNKHGLNKLAETSLAYDHDWAFHAVNATLCFAGCPLFVELSFARDRRFHLSWVESRFSVNPEKCRVFTATASLRDWKRYTGHRDNSDFLRTQRNWLHLAYNVISELHPKYFGE